MSTSIDALLGKIENGGSTSRGKVTAEEWNTLIQAVKENQGAVKTVSVNGGTAFRPDDKGNVDLLMAESNYILTVTASAEGTAPYKIALGSAFNFNLSVSNKYVEGDQQIPVSTVCTATFYCNGQVVGEADIYDGQTLKFDFGPHLNEGRNEIYASVNNNYGEIKQTIVYEVTAIYLSISLPSFDPTVVQFGNWTLDVKTVGSRGNIYIFVDDEGGMVGQQNAGSTVGYEISGDVLVGPHKIEVYAVSEEDETVKTESIISEYLQSDESSTEMLVGTTLISGTSTTLYSVLEVPYWIYAPGFTGEKTVTISVSDYQEHPIESTTQRVNFTDGNSGIQNYTISLFNKELVGDRVVRFEIDDISREIPITIHDGQVNLTEVVGYDLYLSSASRSNADENPREWKFGEYEMTFSDTFEFAENGSGWNKDKDGNVALHVGRGERVSLNYKPFKENPAFGNGSDIPGTKRGMTFSIEFATRNCVDRDTSVVRCRHNGVGFELFANSMLFASNSESLETFYKEDTHIRVDLIIEGSPVTYTYDDNGVTKTSDEARMLVYLDGVYQQMKLITTSTNFMQDIAQNIEIGSDYCDIDIYSIRGYRFALDFKGVTDNYAYDTPVVEDKIKIALRNDVFDSNLNVSYPKLVNARPDLPIMLLGIEKLPNSKTRIPIATTSFNNPNNLDDYDAGLASFTSKDDEIGNQGTSSMNYPMPYRNFDHRFTSKAFSIGGQIFSKWILYPGMPGSNKFTYKKDYASSEMANNAIFSMMYNDMAVGLRNVYPACMTESQRVLGYDKYRQTLIAQPMFCFQYWNNKYTPMGMFNLINYKSDEEYLGFVGAYTWEATRAQCWEIRDNNVFWDTIYEEARWDAEAGAEKNDAFSYYEARYPKDSPTTENDFGHAETEDQIAAAKDETKDILRLHNWLASTNQLTATGALLQEPYTDSQGNVYQYDSASYRLAKFKSEAYDYLIPEQWALYYIWRETFHMYDSGSKNLNMYTMDGIHWGPIVRDADTGGGIDNEGRFGFPFYLEDMDYKMGADFLFNQERQPAGSSTVYNGQLGAVWINMRDAFGSLIQQIFVALYENAPLTNFNYDYTINRFENHQGQWSEALYNFGQKQYYGGAIYSKWIESGLGDKKNQRRYWMNYGFRYRASKYHAGSTTNRITWRQYGTGSDLHMKTYSQMYVSLGFGAYDYNTTKRYRCINPKEGVTIKNELTTNVNDVVMYLFNGDLITDMGDLYKFGDIGSLDLTNAIRLNSLRVGNHLDTENSYVNTKLTALPLTTCAALEEVDLTNCKGFGTGSGQNGIYTLDTTNQKLMKKFFSRGATMTGVTFPENSRLEELELGAKLKSIRMVDMKRLQKFSIEGVSDVERIVITGCDDSIVNSYEIVQGALYSQNNQLKSVEVDNINWTNCSATALYRLAELGAKLKGKIEIPISTPVSFEIKKKLIAVYGNIDDPNNDLYVTYTKRPLSSIIISGSLYFGEVGDYTLDVVPNSDNANTFTDMKWSMTMNSYATINERSGVISVASVGDKDIAPTAQVTLTVTLSDGSVITDSVEVGFYQRDAHVGDYVFADGTYSDKLDLSKTPIAVCFYIDPNDDTRRLAVSLADIGPEPRWGLFPVAFSGLELNDTPDFDPFDVAGNENIVRSTLSSDQKTINDSTYRDAVSGDADGFTVFPATSAEGQIRWVSFQDNVGNYKRGDIIPIGLANTLYTIKHRDVILGDSAVNLPAPEEKENQSEFDNLTALINEIVQNNDGQSKYGQYYYPAASYCFAYEPTALKSGEVLNAKFKKGNWFLPSSGELGRLFYYHYKGYNGAEDFSIFSNAVMEGVMSRFEYSEYWSSSENASNASWSISFYSGRFSVAYKENPTEVRAIVMF